MVSKQYDFHFKMAQVAAEYMRAAGFKVDLQVLDWATLLQRRNDAGVWEIFFTHGPILPEPTLYSFMNSGAPGWWATPGRTTRRWRPSTPSRIRRSGRPSGRDLQSLIYEEVPVAPRRQLQRARRPRQRARRACSRPYGRSSGTSGSSK